MSSASSAFLTCLSSMEDSCSSEMLKSLSDPAHKSEHLMNNAIQSGKAAHGLEFFNHIRNNKHCYKQKILNQGLILACKHGRKFIAQILLFYNANLETRDEDGNTPLLICAEKGFTDIALLLVDKGADVNSYNNDGDTALLLSITTSGSSELARKLLEITYLNFSHKNNNGCTAMSKAFDVLDFSLLELFNKRTNENNITNFKICSDISVLEADEEIASTLGLELIYSTFKINYMTFLKNAVFNRDLRTIQLLLITGECTEDYNIVNDFLYHLLINHEEVNATALIIVEMLLDTKSPVRKRSIDLSESLELGNLKMIELLCRKTTVSSVSPSSVHSVIDNDRCDIIRFLLTNGGKVNTKEYLEYAIRNEQFDCAKLLYTSGAFVDFNKAIFTAVKNNQPKVILFLEELCQLEAQRSLNWIGAEVFIQAVEMGYKEIVAILVDKGVDVNLVFKEKTALMVAKDSDMLKLLIKLGADVNKLVLINGEFYTVLSHILNAFYQKIFYSKDTLLEMISVIIKHLHDLNTTDSVGNTYLMLAVQVPNFIELIKCLLFAGVDVSKQNNHGKTALHLAVGMRSIEVVKVLLDNKANINAKCIGGKTPLIYAVENNSVEMANLLIKNQADVNLGCNDRQSPLMVAVARSNIAMVKLLIENDATIDDEDNKGETALFRVAAHHKVDAGEVVKILAEAGACLNHQNREGKTTLMLAAKNSNFNVLQILCETGADANFLNTINNETALSILTNNKPVDFPCVNYLLFHAGANISFVFSSFIHACIREEQLPTIRKLISLGLGPSNVKFKYLFIFCDLTFKGVSRCW
ncbi:putative ankyrin repeat protein RF_0381 [Physella acuta]|uniref:putative ankyrin repeat protein RF_0381 n=1 Tax=Physella acuta TaxID=109671 RepID=UPI0027DD5EE2|nr:putative ankyrin repeat protein RF_0381 [Physella acuta]